MSTNHWQTASVGLIGKRAVARLAELADASDLGSDAARHEGSTPLARTMKKEIYVAGGSSERLTVVRPILDCLAAIDVQPTYDWTRSPGYDAPLSLEELAEQARMDLEAVRKADILWLLMPEQKSEGAAVELGAALAWQKTIVISGPDAFRPDRLFARLTEHVYLHHTDAFRAVQTLLMA